MKKDKEYTDHAIPMAKDSKKPGHDKDYGPDQAVGADKAMAEKRMKKKMPGAYSHDPEYARQMQRQVGNARMGRMMKDAEAAESGEAPTEMPMEEPEEKAEE